MSIMDDEDKVLGLHWHYLQVFKNYESEDISAKGHTFHWKYFKWDSGK